MSTVLASDPTTLLEPRPPWRRPDHAKERCGVCDAPATFVITGRMLMQSPTLDLPAVLVVLACPQHGDRVTRSMASVDVHVREELLYETWGFRWRVLVEDVAYPFAWASGKVALLVKWCTPSARRERRQRAYIERQNAEAVASLERAQMAARVAKAPTVRVLPPLELVTGEPGSTTSPPQSDASSPDSTSSTS